MFEPLNSTALHRQSVNPSSTTWRVLWPTARQGGVGTAAAALGGAAARVRLADPDFVRLHTGQPIGGVAPVGHPAPIRTLVDTWLARHQQVWPAAGDPHTVFSTTYAELLELTGGRAVDVER